MNIKEINLEKTIAKKRKEKGITQEELAAYIGVSKASVSKWETGQSFPDITFLPQLATYFNISIDELIGYQPQMEKEDIQKLYHRLAADFASKPFAAVKEECDEILKKYYSCFPLLLQMAVLLLNHHMLAEEAQTKQAALQEVLELCRRIEKESGDVWLSKEAVSLEATCCLMAGRPQDALELYGEELRPILQDTQIVAQAYQMQGKIDKAIETTQVSIYQHLLFFVDGSAYYLMLSADSKEKFDEILERTLQVAKIYELDRLHPNSMANLYLGAAQVYCAKGEEEKALDMLERYSNICAEFFPCKLRGDRFFDQIEGWMENFDLGTAAPRSDDVIKESLIRSVANNPALERLHEHKRYQALVEKIKFSLGRD